MKAGLADKIFRLCFTLLLCGIVFFGSLYCANSIMPDLNGFAGNFSFNAFTALLSLALYMFCFFVVGVFFAFCEDIFNE